MKSKEIVGIEPFNDIFYRNCFYNSLFAIIKYFDKNIFHILANDINVYSKYENGVNVNYIEDEAQINIIKEMGIKINTKNKCENVVGDIKSALCKDRLVILWIDCYYESIRVDTYLKEHLPHTLVVCGFDDLKKEFTVIEHKHKDNLSYRKTTISYEDIINSYEGYIENYVHDDFIVFFEVYSNDCEKKLELQDEFNYIVQKFVKNFNNKLDCVEKGIEDLEKFIETYKKIAIDKEQFSKVCPEWLDMINWIINTKYVEQYKIINFLVKNQK